MKKILILFAIALLSFFAISQITYALPDDEINITQQVSWSAASIDGKIYFYSSRIHLDTHKLKIEVPIHLENYANAFKASVGPTFNKWSRIEFYDTQSSTTLVGYFSLSDIADYLILELDNWNMMLPYQNKYASIVLMMDDTQGHNHTNILLEINTYRNEMTIEKHYPRMLAEVSDLPLTTGNPYQEGITGYGRDWAFEANVFAIDVVYLSTSYKLSISNVDFEDASFLNRVESVDYYSVDGEKFLQFNFFDNPNVLLPKPDGSTYTGNWNGFAVWNLTTNEFVMYNRALALTYIEVTSNREMYAYLYMPNIHIDNLLAVAGNFHYRYGYRQLNLTQRYHDWEIATFALEKDETSLGRLGGIEGALPQWTFDVIKYSTGAVAAGAILSMIPGLQGIGFPLLFGGVAGMLVSGVSTIHHVMTGHISELEEIFPAGALRDTLNQHYTLALETPTTLPSNAKVHKLFLGLFTKLNTNVVEPKASTFKYTEITWVSKGEVISLDERFINTQAILDQEYLNTLPPDGQNPIRDAWNDIVKFFSDLGAIGLALGAILALVLIGSALSMLSNGFNNAKTFIRRNKIITIIIGVIIIVLALRLMSGGL